MTITQIQLLPDAPAARPARARRNPEARALREALAPYFTPAELARMVADGPAALDGLRQRLRAGCAPPEVQAMIAVLAEILRPDERVQIRSPKDVAALLMVQMAAYDQEHLVVVSLDTKNRVQHIGTVYKGSVNSAIIRVGEVFKEPIRRNSTAVIIAHNHPSADPTPSPEDVMVTRQIVEAGKLFDIDCLDHLILAGGQFVSLRERGLGGFPS